MGNIAQVGAMKRDSTNDGSIKVRISKTMIHPNYNPLTHENDFQLLHLGGWVDDKAIARLNKNSTIPERLQGSGDGDDVSVLTLVGMGRTEEDGPISDVLMKTTITRVIDSSDCQDAYPEYLVNGEVVICATGGDDSSSEGRDRYVTF